MQSYLIERNFGHVTEEQLAAGGSESKRVAAEQFADTIVWTRSHASHSDSGLTTHCLYEAKDEATVRAHASAAGLPCDTILAVDVVGPDDFA